MKTNIKKYVADFETSTYPGQEETEVWAAAITKIGNKSDTVEIFNSIDAFFDYLFTIRNNIEVYFHNLKFDGSFIITYLLCKNYHESLYETEDIFNKNLKVDKFNKKKDLNNNEFSVLISGMGQWYDIILKQNNRLITFKDSLKLIPLSVREMGKTFETKHQKTSIEYIGERHAGGEITEEEKGYISNDVLVVKEALEFMFNDGNDKLTIGSCCYHNFKKTLEQRNIDMRTFFPDLRQYNKTEDYYTGFKNIESEFENAEQYIRRSYHGGWCYVKDDRKEQVINNGCVADVNSLYPSMMESESGNNYPYGKPHFFKGDIPESIKDKKSKYYFVRFRCKFELKDGKLPFVQIKHNFLYNGQEMLKDSRGTNFRTGEKFDKVYNELTGETEDLKPEMVMTCTDWKLFNENYTIYDLEILDGCWFNTVLGIFDDYINYWAEIKQNSTGGRRQIAKLFLNNLYGKMASREDSDFKIPFLKEDGSLSYKTVLAKDRTPGFIAIGSAITSYARNFTIRAAQANYEHFIYADTDSIHCDCKPEELKGIKIDNTHFNCWKIERTWDKGYFLRAKTYIEVKDNDYNVKCAGMTEKCKDIFVNSIRGTIPAYDDCDNDEKLFYYNENKKPIKRDITDFKVGLVVPGKLMAKHIKGGTVLEPTYFTLREN